MKTFYLCCTRGMNPRTFAFENVKDVPVAMEIFAVAEGVSPGLAYADWYRRTHQDTNVLSVFASQDGDGWAITCKSG